MQATVAPPQEREQASPGGQLGKLLQGLSLGAPTACTWSAALKPPQSDRVLWVDGSTGSAWQEGAAHAWLSAQMLAQGWTVRGALGGAGRLACAWPTEQAPAPRGESGHASPASLPPTLPLPPGLAGVQ